MLSMKNAPQRNKFFITLMMASPEVALAEFRKMIPIPDAELDHYHRSLLEIAERFPAQIDSLLAETDGGTHELLETIVLSKKLVENFDDTLEAITKMPDGYERFLGDYNTFRLLDPKDILRNFRNFPPEWREKFSRNPRMFGRASAKDPGIADFDWEEAGFSTEQVHAIHRSIVAFESQFNPETTTPRDLVTALTGEQITGDQRNLTNRIRFWSDEEKEQLAATYRSLEGSEKGKLAAFAAKANVGIALRLKGEAIDYLLRHGETEQIPDWEDGDSRSATLATSRHALDLMKTDVQAATSWLDKLPERSARLQTKQNLALNWRNLDPEAAQKWIATQPAVEREAINQFLKDK